MQGMKRNSGHDNSAAAATTAVENSTHDSLPSMDATPSEFCAELSKTFRVRSSEVALLRLEGGMLKFLFPEELKTAGAIPLSHQRLRRTRRSVKSLSYLITSRE